MIDDRPFAIVTDGQWRKSVCAIRSLGRAGYRVIVLGDSWFTTGFYSRYTEKRFKGPTAEKDQDGFGKLLHRACMATRGKYTVILPMEDASCEWLLKNASHLPQTAKFLLPDPPSFAIASDKARTAILAEECGIPFPKYYAPENISALRDLVRAHEIDKFILKPRQSSGSAGIVYGRGILLIDLEHHWAEHGPLLFQERIPSDGTAFGVSLLYDSLGVHLASFEYRRLRQYPVSGGPSTQRISVPLSHLTSLSRRLVERLNWRGVAMVEWKVDPETGKPLLLEINPRFWGSLALAVRAGVDFPRLYADAALGKASANSSPSYRLGTISRWLIPGDILRYYNEPTQLREPLGVFLHGIFRNSEEFEGSDLRGSVACCVCPALLVLNPKYWKYLRSR
jgi:predicted ATP-grasp superfamily ATP-dependent carboligase